MKKNWGYFIGAVILAGYFLLRSGAPIFPVALGMLFAAFMTARAARRSA